MNAVAEETERLWTGRVDAGGYVLTREVRGVRARQQSSMRA